VTAGQFRRRRGEALPADGPVERLPAAGVSWTAARDYCAGVGGRLPTEAEWEYAARGGTSTRYYGAPDAIAWYSANTDAPQPVATKTANAFGLHDMLGNVSEWVRDRYYNRYDDNAGADLEEPLAANAFATARGGSFVSDAPGLRASRRLEMFPDAEEPHIGFRCAIDRL
jgi:formylglycine-generating enzyme required for sulfatase activity